MNRISLIWPGVSPWHWSQSGVYPLGVEAAPPETLRATQRSDQWGVWTSLLFLPSFFSCGTHSRMYVLDIIQPILTSSCQLSTYFEQKPSCEWTSLTGDTGQRGFLCELMGLWTRSSCREIPQASILVFQVKLTFRLGTVVLSLRENHVWDQTREKHFANSE